MTDPHPTPLRALQEDGDADIFAQTSVKEDTLSRRGTFVGRTNRLANSVHPLSFQFRQCVSCRPQVISFCGRVGRIQLRGLADGGGRWKNSQQRLRAGSVRGKKEKALHRNCAKKRTEEETCARDSAQSAEAPWRRRARGTARRQRKCAVRALGVEEKVIARENAQGQVRRRRAFVWRRDRSGHARVCARHAGR